MDITDRAQTFGGLFSRQVTLGFCQHFIADHKLTHRRGAQQRRVEVRMQLPVLVFFTVERRAVPAHGVGERALEQVVVTAG